MGKMLGAVLTAVGFWMLVSPQSLTGLAQLKWMYRYAFPGEVLLGIVILGFAYYLLALMPAAKKKSASPSSH